MKDKTTLFVCSGNTCRSQMAEALARHLFASSKFISAGTKAIANQPTSRHAVTLLLERGIAWQGGIHIVDKMEIKVASMDEGSHAFPSGHDGHEVGPLLAMIFLEFL